MLLATSNEGRNIVNSLSAGPVLAVTRDGRSSLALRLPRAPCAPLRAQEPGEVRGLCAGIAEPALHDRAQLGATAAQHVHVPREIDRALDVIGRVVREPRITPDAPDEARALSANERFARQGDDRATHPQCIAGRRAAGEREWIECDVDFAIRSEQVRILASAVQGQPRGVDSALGETCDEVRMRDTITEQ